MDIIMLNGPSNRGKTSTIRIVHNLILSHGGISRALDNPTSGDFTDEVSFTNRRGELQKIYFNSEGDSVKGICNRIEYALNQGFDKMVFFMGRQALHLRGWGVF